RPGRHDRMGRRRPSRRPTRVRTPCPNPRRRPMIATALELPYRPAKPRRRGITMVIDNGLPTGAFRDHVSSAGELIDFVEFAEVGLKDPARADRLRAEDWVAYIRQDLEAGARLVVAEARESGRSGICHADGRLRSEVLDGILGSGIDVESLMFEAPTK